MRIWVDDVRMPPNDSKSYTWCKSVNETKTFIEQLEAMYEGARKVGMFVADFFIEVIDLDHDAGEFFNDGGDYIRLLDWLEETDRDYPIRIHSMNPVGVQNMRAIIKRNQWDERE